MGAVSTFTTRNLYTHTHTHTHIYIYIYIRKKRKTEKNTFFLRNVLLYSFFKQMNNVTNRYNNPIISKNVCSSTSASKDLHHPELSHTICIENQLTCFYMIQTLIKRCSQTEFDYD